MEIEGWEGGMVLKEVSHTQKMTLSPVLLSEEDGYFHCT